MESVTNYNQLKLIPKNQMEHWRPKVVTGKRGIPYIYTEEQNGLPTVFVPQDGVVAEVNVAFLYEMPHVQSYAENWKVWIHIKLLKKRFVMPTKDYTYQLNMLDRFSSINKIKLCQQIAS